MRLIQTGERVGNRASPLEVKQAIDVALLNATTNDSSPRNTGAPEDGFWVHIAGKCPAGFLSLDTSRRLSATGDFARDLQPSDFSSLEQMLASYHGVKASRAIKPDALMRMYDCRAGEDRPVEVSRGGRDPSSCEQFTPCGCPFDSRTTTFRRSNSLPEFVARCSRGLAERRAPSSWLSWPFTELVVESGHT